jgi:hypothetical protein
VRETCLKFEIQFRRKDPRSLMQSALLYQRNRLIKENVCLVFCYADSFGFQVYDTQTLRMSTKHKKNKDQMKRIDSDFSAD